MKIAIHNLYGINNGSKAYYRKCGYYGFDFIYVKELSTDFTAEECKKIMESAAWYCKQYNASHMTVEE